MLDNPLIPTAAKTSRSETTAARATPSDKPAKESKNGEFEKEIAAQTEEDEASAQKGGTEETSPAGAKNEARKTAVGDGEGSETDGILTDLVDEQPEEPDDTVNVRAPVPEDPPEAPVIRRKTTTELAVLQQARPGIPEKPVLDSNRTVSAEIMPRTGSAEQNEVRGADALPAGAATRQNPPGSPVQSADQRPDDPRIRVQNQNAATVSASLSAPAASAPAHESARLAVPGPPATVASEKPGRRSEKLRTSDADARAMPAPAEARAEMRSTVSAIAMRPANPALMQVNQVGAQDNPDLMTPIVQDADSATQWDPRVAGSSTAQQALLRAETPGMIGRQMAEALHRLPDRPVELALSPRELGNVRMTISAGEGSITVNVLAERPETLDLMRRNIDELAREFQALGFDTISFAFSEGQQQTNDDHSDDAPLLTGTDAEDRSDSAETANTPVRLVETTGLDLRL